MSIFLGTFANAGLVILGTLLGLIAKNIKGIDKISSFMFQGFGLFMAVLGIQSVKIDSPIYFLICLIIGSIIGELLDIDKQFNKLGDFFQKLFSKNSDSNFSKGFVESSLLFCIGSMTFLGAIEAGTLNEHTIYISKGIIDGVSAITFAANYGIGTAFSAISILLYQGLLTAFANILMPVLTQETISMCVSVGSLSLIAIGLNMLGITKIKAANYLPCMFIPMIWQAILLLF